MTITALILTCTVLVPLAGLVVCMVFDNDKPEESP